MLDIAGDARRAFDVLKGGGVAILPMNVGYSLIGGGEAALARIFETKQRAATKLNAMVADNEIHRELHVLDGRGFDIVKAITQDHDLPLGAIAPARLDHPLLKAVSPETLERSHRGGTIAMLLNAGPFHAEICRLSRTEGHPLFGSSANR
ncbi:MAG: Sua5/YciO/YrdC/YwlC family protein, partial [Alphaproteobacteria bacterium]